ncbi:MAG: hypothetical protein ACXWN4_08010 [Candidatus Limnocylindrales bacterium]
MGTVSEATGRVTMEVVGFGGWPGSIRLSNGEIELIATTDVGPRIVRLGFVGGQNLFHTFKETLGKTGGEDWHSYGGHRLWHAPEVVPRTYAADNEPVDHSWDGQTLILRNSERANGLEKELRITLSATRQEVEVVHRIVNKNPWAIELSAWALSVMAQGGRAIFPQEDFRPHPDALTPARPLVLWYFTDMSDPRWTWGRKYIQLRQDPLATTKQKAGLLNRKGWAAYVLGSDAFIKRYPYDPGAVYADMGCNTETYTDPDILEIESLGPVTRLEPEAHLEHVETWLLAHTECGSTDAEIDAGILPLVDKLPAIS